MAVLLALALTVTVAMDPDIPPPYAPPADEMPVPEVDTPEQPPVEVVEIVPTVVARPVLVRAVWDRLAQCESSGIWSRNSGNGYYGGLQEDMTFWRRYGGLAYASRPDLASREAQVVVAERGLAVQGWGAWPACSRYLGLR